MNLRRAGATPSRVLAYTSWLNKPFTATIRFNVSQSLPKVLVSKEHPLCVEDPQLGHEVEIDKGQADQ